MQTRRTFIFKGSMAGGLLLLGSFPFHSLAKAKIIRLTILHTNDTQSQLEPFEAYVPKFAGLGGIQARADRIQQIRAEELNVLLFDAGDFFQGSPYFDTYKGEPEIRAMNLMGYDAACIGERDFDGGTDNLATQITKAQFSFVCANYDFTKTSLDGKILPYKIIEKAGIKIGVLGIGLQLKGRVSEDISNSIPNTDPVVQANKTALYLKKKEKCDFIICLSHLGLGTAIGSGFNDHVLAKQTEYIDLIIGGHSHTLLQKPLKYFNKGKNEVFVVQAGWGGAFLGRIDYVFSTRKNILSANAQTVELPK